jgi:hypothetical protein
MVVMAKRMYIPEDMVLEDELLKEVHETKLNMHLRSTKMYKDLKELYWWPNMKKQIAKYVTCCAIYQQVKTEHQKSAGLCSR